MQNILEELYRGNINPDEKCFDPGSRYAQFTQIVSDNEEKLTSFLAGISAAKEEQHLFSQLINAQGEILMFSELNCFIEGFRLGTGIMLDTFVLLDKSVVRDID